MKKGIIMNRKIENKSSKWHKIITAILIIFSGIVIGRWAAIHDQKISQIEHKINNIVQNQSDIFENQQAIVQNQSDIFENQQAIIEMNASILKSGLRREQGLYRLSAMTEEFYGFEKEENKK
jgi:hypothetical protein